jgi:P-type conjugative transfer protein TrbJ
MFQPEFSLLSQAQSGRQKPIIAIITELIVSVTQARALSVFDGANYSQNLLTAIRTLQMINNQVRQLQNEAQMLINMARHLERLDYSSLSQLNQAINQIDLPPEKWTPGYAA